MRSSAVSLILRAHLWLGLPFVKFRSELPSPRRKARSSEKKRYSSRAAHAEGRGGMAPPPVPLRARMTAVAGALVLTPDTALMRLTKMQTSSRWYTAWGIVFYRGFGRLILLPPLWMVAKGASPREFARVARHLGWRHLCGGALLYTIQNVAFIVAANLTFIASVLAILATGPLMSCFAAKAFLGESVPRHTWIAAVACAACVLVLFSDAFVEKRDDETNAPATRDHLVGNFVALIVPAALALYWTACKSAKKDADMIPALTLSGLIGGSLATLVVLGNVPFRRNQNESFTSPLMPTPPADDGGVAVAALVTQTLSVAVAFALLTLGAKDVPSAEVSLIMLIELALGPALVWAAVGEMPTWRVWLGAAGVLATMAAESAAAVADERREGSADFSAAGGETGGSGDAAA